MVQSIVVLSERALLDSDAERLVALHDPERPSFRVLVPTASHRHVLATILDKLSLLELREAVDAAAGREEPDRAVAEADVAASVAALQRQGVEASGDVIDGGDPIGAVTAEVDKGADEVIVVTTPHAVEDTLHRDWASVARERLGVPVLHVYSGSSWVG
ncbi:MAG TPA: hypothetical protein VMT69_18455 [Kineosporiaceae bacterium]|nr:hypothetical protein [Kineosporiaceae bacterium]